MAIKIGNKAVTSVYKGAAKVNDIIRNGNSYLKEVKKSIFEKATGMTMLAFINNGYAESGKAYDSQGNEIENWSTYWTYKTSSSGDYIQLTNTGATELSSAIPVIVDKKILTRTYKMFGDCSNLTSLDLSSFDTSNVTDMQSMFNSCSNLTNINLSNFDTSNVTKMNSMFYKCSSLTSLDLSNFDTSNVTSMYAMFNGCSNLTSLDLRNFDTSNVTDMENMFRQNSKLTVIYVGDGWTTSNATTTNMFTGCGTSTVTKV